MRVHIRDFSKGIWASGPKDTSPPGSFRRSKGTYALRTSSIRSRDGSTLVHSNVNAHSLYRFNGKRYAGSSYSFYEDLLVVKAGLSGDRLSFVSMPCSSGLPDCLFVAGGGTLFKVNPIDDTIESWGIQPPPDGFTVTPYAKASIQIDNFDDYTSWSASSATLSNEGTLKQEGSESMKMVVAANTQGSATKAIAIDLSTNIPDEAHIQMWVRIDFPIRVAFIQVLFDVGDGSFSTDYYSLSVGLDDSNLSPGTIIPISKQISVFNSRTGTTRTFTEAGKQTAESLLVGSQSLVSQLTDLASAQGQSGQTTYPSSADTWTLLRLPKTLFVRSGTNGNTWANVAAVKLIVRTNSGGTATLYFDDLRIAGFNSLVGNYQYQITYLNSITGTRSNPNPTPVEVDNLDRQKVAISNFPTPTDPQVDTIEIWRTLGGGVALFLDAQIPIAQTEYDDDIADFPGINSLQTTYLQSIQLPTDNIPPAPTYNDCFGPYNGAMWWTRDSDLGGRGRVYFSPPGRPEVVEGFLNVTTDDDQTQKGVIWNNTPYVLTTKGLYQILGTDPYIAQSVTGCPGTTQPFTVTPTPFGIVYEADDGTRVFNGITSALVAFEGVGPAFRGQVSEDIGSFVGLVSTFARDEYFVSDGNTTLALNLRDEVWREPGVPAIAFYYERDTGSILTSFGGNIYTFEDEGVQTGDGNAPFAFEVEPPSFLTSEDKAGVVDMLIVEANTSGQVIVPTMIIDDVLIVLPGFTSTSRVSFEYKLGRPGRVIGVRFDGNVTKYVEIQGVAIDVYTPQAVNA